MPNASGTIIYKPPESTPPESTLPESTTTSFPKKTTL